MTKDKGSEAMQSGLRENLAYFGYSLFLSIKGFAVNTIKYNKEFYRVLDRLEKSQWYSQEKLKGLQDTKLSKLIAHAYENVPYYNRLFKKHGIRPNDIKCTEDLKKIPLLSKDALRASPQDFVAANCNRKMLASGWTTGTTGTPVNALRSRVSITFENAVLWRQKKWAGIDVGCRKTAVWGTIWDNVIVPSSIKSPPFWRRNISDNQLLFSYYHMSDDTLPLYFKKMREFKPDFIEGFPSTILTLSDFLKRHNKTFPVKGIFTSSEPLYDEHRKEIEEQFETRVFDHYGQAERVVAASDCPEHSGLHVHYEYGVLEIIKDNCAVSPGENGEIIGTGLNNYAMPLIRYRTGDIARFASAPCPCGRKMPLLQSVDGRKADSIVTPDGRVIPGGGLMGAFHGIKNIGRSQIVQEDANSIIVRIVRNREESGVDTARLISNLKKCVGEDIRIEVDITDSLSERNTIKHRWVVSKVKMDI